MENIKNTILTYALLVALSLFGALKTTAQRVAVGLRFMPTFSTFDIKSSSGNTISGTISLGYGVGAQLAVGINRYLGVQGEIVYSSLAQKHTEQDVERKIKLQYVNIPLLMSFNSGRTKMINLNIVAGPQIGVNVGSSLRTSGGINSDTARAVLAVRNGDLGFAYGIGLDFGLNEARTVRLDVGFRGVLGLFDISDHSGPISGNSYYLLDQSHVNANSAYMGLSFLF